MFKTRVFLLLILTSISTTTLAKPTINYKSSTNVLQEVRGLWSIEIHTDFFTNEFEYMSMTTIHRGSNSPKIGNVPKMIIECAKHNELKPKISFTVNAPKIFSQIDTVNFRYKVGNNKMHAGEWKVGSETLGKTVTISLFSLSDTITLLANMKTNDNSIHIELAAKDGNSRLFTFSLKNTHYMFNELNKNCRDEAMTSS